VTARRAAVLGSPIGHSLSPVLHRAAYAALGLTGWTYDAYDVADPGLTGFLDRLDATWVGLSLTVPLKAAVLPLVDEVSPLARAVGGADTVLLGLGGRRADNTDVPGIVVALRERGLDRVERAAVLGGGATARAAVAALAAVADTVTAYVRSRRRADGLRATAEATGATLTVRGWDDVARGMHAADLVVSTMPAGATDGLVGRVPDLPATLLEVVHDPWRPLPTPFVAAWSAAGGDVIGGLDLVVHQAILQVALMTGSTVDVRRFVPVLRAAGQAALAGG
jgi:shikimate dehydrogenase